MFPLEIDNRTASHPSSRESSAMAEKSRLDDQNTSLRAPSVRMRMTTEADV